MGLILQLFWRRDVCYFFLFVVGFGLFLIFGIFLGGDLVFWLMFLLAFKEVPAAKGVCICMTPCRVDTQDSGLAKSLLYCFVDLFLSPFC